VDSVSRSEIVVRTDRTTIRIPAADVLRIESSERTRWRRGLWIGAAIGAAGVLALGEGSAPGIALMGAIGAGLGAAIGAALDRSHPRRTVIYAAAQSK
jgi:hypothetical protein